MTMANNQESKDSRERLADALAESIKYLPDQELPTQQDAATTSLRNRLRETLPPTNINESTHVRSPRMKHVLLPAAADLDRWAATRLEARAELARIVRRLILATTRPSALTFPAGDSSQRHGWDGRLLVHKESGNAFVPEGYSVWELSVRKDRTTKANQDYDGGTENPGDVRPQETTYVAVSLRRWEGKDEWSAARCAEGRWKNVVALDADNLETWLEEAPAVHLWLAEQLRTMPTDLQTLDRFWSAWQSATTIALSREVVLAGRDDTEKALQEWLHDEGQLGKALRCDTADEAIAVLAATIKGLPEHEAEAWFSRAVVVASEEQSRELSRASSQLLLVGRGGESLDVGAIAQRGHRSVLALGRRAPVLKHTLEVSRLRTQPLQEALTKLGIEQERANELAQRARGGLQALRRALGRLPEALVPPWATAHMHPVLSAALLAGAWNDDNALDQQALAEITGRSYDDVRRACEEIAREDDPPIRHVGKIWRFVAHDDAWELLAERLSSEDVRRFTQQVQLVLETPEPRWDLRPDQRWMAGVLCKDPQYSEDLRTGLISSMALLVTDEIPIPVGLRMQPLVVTRHILEVANKDWRIWASLSRFLGDLAEIDPDGFLDALETDLRTEVPQVLQLFQESGDSSTSVTPHTGLLWALERLAWSPQYLTRAVLALGHLAQRDPGVKILNRPTASLHGIFVAWCPQTLASLNERLVALDRLLSNAPHVGRRLLVGLVPSNVSESLFSNASPRWRNWKPSGDVQVSRREVSEAISAYAGRILSSASGEPDYWLEIVDTFGRLPRATRTSAIELLRQEAATFSESDRMRLWERLRDFVNKQRRFRTAQWALPEEEVARVTALLPLFEPRSVVARNRWLFASDPQMDGPLEWNEAHELLKRRRAVAAEEVMRAGGLDAVLEVADSTEYQGAVGRALGSMNLAEADERRLLTEVFAAPERKYLELVAAFIAARIEKRGVGWRDGMLMAHRSEWTPEQTMIMYWTSGPVADTWDALETEEPSVQRLYWQRTPPIGFGQNTDVKRAARQYLLYERPLDVVKILALYAKKELGLEALILEALETALKSPDAQLLGALWYDVQRLMELLAESDASEDRVAALEWKLLGVIRKYEGVPQVLIGELEREPEFFVTLCTIAFKAEDEEARDLDEAGQRRWRNAYQLLELWRGVPGRTEQEIDGTKLDAWIRRARKRLLEEKRLKIGDLRIGQMLSHAPGNQEGEWPHPAICAVLDATGSSELIDGFVTGVMNSRGVFTKNPAEGGRQEREIAERYRQLAGKIQTRWPRTAAALRQLEQHYVIDAEREDLRADQLEDRGTW